MIFLYGTAHYGQVDVVDGEHIVTRFFHLYGVPIVPLESIWVTGWRRAGVPIGHPCRWSARSIVVAYVRWWGALVAPLAGFVAVVQPIALIGCLVLAALAVWSWRLRFAHDPRITRRVALQRRMLGTACDPLAMRPVDAAALLPQAEARFAPVSDGRTPADVARFGATSEDQAAAAFVVLRLVAATATGSIAAEARRASEQVLAGSRDDEVGEREAPYRAAASALVAVAQARPLSVGGELVSFRVEGLGVSLVCTLLVLVFGGEPCASRMRGGFAQSRPEIAHSTTRKLALEAYPQFVLKPVNHDGCPTLAELGEYANGNVVDPWGREYRFRCHDLPAGAVGIAVWSTGPNGRDEQGAGDDLASWR